MDEGWYKSGCAMEDNNWHLAFGVVDLVFALGCSAHWWTTRDAARWRLQSTMVVCMALGGWLGGVAFVLEGLSNVPNPTNSIVVGLFYVLRGLGFSFFFVGKFVIVVRLLELIYVGKRMQFQKPVLGTVVVLCLPFVVLNCVAAGMSFRAAASPGISACNGYTLVGCANEARLLSDESFEYGGFAQLYQSGMLICAALCVNWASLRMVHVLRKHSSGAQFEQHERRILLCVAFVGVTFSFRAIVQSITALGYVQIGEGSSNPALERALQLEHEMHVHASWLKVLPEILSEPIAGALSIWGLGTTRKRTSSARSRLTLLSDESF